MLQRDYLSFLISDLLIQFRDGSFGDHPNTSAVLQAIANRLMELLTTFQDLHDKTYFRVLDDGRDTGARGVRLDKIGEVVDLSRKNASAVSESIETVDKLGSAPQGTVEAWLKNSSNNFSMYYPGRILDDEPYSRYIAYKIFLNNAWCTYADLMKAIRTFWTESDVYYEERPEEDARIFLRTPELQQAPDGRLPNTRLFLLAPVVKAAGVQLFRETAVRALPTEGTIHVGTALWNGVLETKLPYWLYDHKFGQHVRGTSKMEGIIQDTLPENEHELFIYTRIGSVVGPKVYWYMISLRYSSMQDTDVLVFPTIYKGEVVKQLDPPSRTFDERHSGASPAYYKSVYIPNTIEIIGADMFDNFVNLESCYIPASVQSIGTYAFRNCPNLKRVTIDVKAPIGGISAYMFDKCYNLEYVTIPKTVQSIADNAFRYCDNLKTVVFGGTRSEWADIWISSRGNSALNGATKIYLGG